MYRQGKAILQFESADVATKFTNECENGSIMYKNTLRFHPSYCKLVEPKAKKENVQEIHNVDLKGIYLLKMLHCIRCYTNS